MAYRTYLLIVAIFCYSSQDALSDAMCEKISPEMSGVEFQKYIDEEVKHGNLPPGKYYQPGPRERCYVKPKNGFVPNKETARAIAVAVVANIVTDRGELSELYFKVTELPNGDWHVDAYFPVKGMRQTVHVIEIGRSDGRIIRYWDD